MQVAKVRIEDSNAAVRQRVSSFLQSRHFPAFRNFKIEVDQGEVTLTGKVQSYYEKQIAMTSCQNVAGVVTLIDEIVVQFESDVKLREQSRRGQGRKGHHTELSELSEL